jgi:NADH-quinone oxidoreductase subunit J
VDGKEDRKPEPIAMNLHAFLFYLLAAVILAATGMAVSRRNLVHAVVYLVISFFGSALLFYLLGAPLLAALEVIIYAGAIMVLFLFIVMMLHVEKLDEHFFPASQWMPAAGLCVVIIVAGLALVFSDPDGGGLLRTATAHPAAFGAFVFQRHWLAVEIVSLLLLVALPGVLFIGKSRRARRGKEAP